MHADTFVHAGFFSGRAAAHTALAFAVSAALAATWFAVLHFFGAGAALGLFVFAALTVFCFGKLCWTGIASALWCVLLVNAAAETLMGSGLPAGVLP